jgi:hypothetical protein
MDNNGVAESPKPDAAPVARAIKDLTARPKAPATTAKTAPKTTRLKVSREVAATIREQDAAVDATIKTAQDVANAAIGAAQQAAERAGAIRDSATLMILRQHGIAFGRVIATEQEGDDSILVVDLTPPPKKQEAPNA